MWITARKVAMIAMVMRRVRTFSEVTVALVSMDLVEMDIGVTVSQLRIVIGTEKSHQ